MTNLLTFFVTAVCLVLIILIATYIINIPTNDYEKHSSYECGFEPFGDARGFFDIHFYTIGLLFIIFDLEIVFLIPFIIDIANLSVLGYSIFILFMLIVLVGFYYEWSIGLLNWVPQKAATKSVAPLAFVGTNLQILGNVDLVFLILWCLIVLSLLLNQLSNLVYRILNLAWLSLLVVALWSYYIDLSFLFIVYILAFVGAVVMLFLSVVLMLPASVVSSDSQMSAAVSISLIRFESHSLTDFRASDVLVFIAAFVLLNWFYKHLFKNATIRLNLFSDWLKYINSNAHWFRENFRGFKDYFGISWSVGDLNHLTSTVEKQSKLDRRFYPVLYWYDFLYYLYVNLESTLYGMTRDEQLELHRNDQAESDHRDGLEFSIFKIFEATVNSKEGHVELHEGFDFNKSALEFTHKPKYYVPFKFKYSLFNVFKPVYFTKLRRIPVIYNKCNVRERNESKLMYDRLVFLTSIVEFFTVNAIIKLVRFVKALSILQIYNLVSKFWVIKSLRSYFWLDSSVERIRSATNYKWKREMLPKSAKVAMYVHDLEYYVYINIDARLYDKNWELAHRYDRINKLWGSLFDKFEVYSTATKVAPKGLFLNVDLYTPPTTYVPYRFKYSLFKLLPPIYRLRPGQYFEGTAKYISLVNYLVFIKCFVEFFACNTVLVLWHKLKSCNWVKGYDILKGSIILVSVVLLGAPLAFKGNVLDTAIDTGKSDVDGLLAIKKILYEASPELAIISVVVLLVALIGSAVFTRSRTKTK